jgi:glutathione S-transferase
MNMKFYMTPGSCSTGIHILLEECGLVFEAYLVNLMAGDQHKEDYLAMNPKATIPTLVRPDGKALTDFQSIAWWIAKTYPKRKLLPDTLDDELRVLEIMNYAVNTIHGQGFTRIFTTEKYTPNEADYEAVKARGQEIVNAAFVIVNELLAGRDYVVEQFGIADAALFYVEFWANYLKMSLPENCEAHYQRLLKRPAVRQVLMEEGYSSLLNSSQ